jgi:hypothetical protein
MISALNLRALNLSTFLQMAAGVDDETWLHNLRAGEYSSWFSQAIKDLSGHHSLELLQRGINRVPGMAADAVCDHSRIEQAWVVKTCRVDRY